MNPNLIIGIASIAGIAAGFACVGAHWIAKRRRWSYVSRYIIGVLFGMGAFVFPLRAAMDTLDALVLTVALGIIFGSEAIGTWIAHDADPDLPPKPASLTPEGDKLLRDAIDEELRK